MLLYTKEFPLYVWEEEVEQLKIPHFHFCNKVLLYTSEHRLIVPAFFILGAGTGIATLVFICELLVGGFTRLKNDVSQVKVMLII